MHSPRSLTQKQPQTVLREVIRSVKLAGQLVLTSPGYLLSFYSPVKRWNFFISGKSFRCVSESSSVTLPSPFCLFSVTGDFAVLLKAGMTVKQAVLYNALSAMLAYLGMSTGIFIRH